MSLTGSVQTIDVFIRKGKGTVQDGPVLGRVRAVSL